ncbi:MAG: PKD domain-containing protein, partial [Gammaproteobacteria bacterium]|nr:PKD domain-containing protein [Gammaproteobacteria bacterium]
MCFNLNRKLSIVGTALLSMALLLGSGNALAMGPCLSAFTAKYPNSLTGSNASCQTCHQSVGEPYNGYGWALRVLLAELSASCSNTDLNNGTLAAALGNIEGLDSDMDVSGGFSNLEEINADAQPGWTAGANNTVYFDDGSTTAGQQAPGGIGDLDPTAVNQPPVADANGPYDGSAGVPVQFDGSGSVDSDGSIVSYSWDFGDGENGVGVNPTHTYAATGTFDVSLIVMDDVGAMDSDQTIATIGAQNPDADVDVTGVTDISGDGVPDVAALSQQMADRPRVRYYSGANRQQFDQVNYLSNAWAAVAAATVADGNQDGVRNDPAVAVLGRNIATNKLFVQVRMAEGGASIAGFSVLSAAWTPVDVVVIDDANGDGVSNDTAIGVLGVNPAGSSRRHNLVQVRRLSTPTSVLNNVYFAN